MLYIRYFRLPGSSGCGGIGRTTIVAARGRDERYLILKYCDFGQKKLENRQGFTKSRHINNTCQKMPGSVNIQFVLQRCCNSDWVKTTLGNNVILHISFLFGLTSF